MWQLTKTIARTHTPTTPTHSNGNCNNKGNSGIHQEQWNEQIQVRRTITETNESTCTIKKTRTVTKTKTTKACYKSIQQKQKTETINSTTEVCRCSQYQRHGVGDWVLLFSTYSCVCVCVWVQKDLQHTYLHSALFKMQNPLHLRLGAFLSPATPNRIGYQVRFVRNTWNFKQAHKCVYWLRWA